MPTPTKEGKYTHIETEDECWVNEQSEGHNWSSCMSIHYQGQYREKHLSGDKKAFKNGGLFFWTVGKPKSQDKVGFEARAKLRLVTKDRGLHPEAPIVKGSEVWLLIDKIYPDLGWIALYSNMEELRGWFVSYCAAMGFEMKGKQNIYQYFFVHSQIWTRKSCL
jgi:hypothetical protein